MANEQNLKPIRSVNEARELGRKGGIKSGETRRRKAALRDTMNRLLTMQVEVEGLSDILRLDGGESTYEEVIAMAMIQKASLGDVKAYQAIMKTVGQTEIQSADIQSDGGLLIKTISASEEDLKTMFQDEFKIKKLTVTERESTVATYENYTNLNALVKYIGGILGVVIYREKESPMDRIDALEEHVDNLTEANKSREAENAELIATVDSILTDVLPALLGDGAEETDTENTDTK